MANTMRKNTDETARGGAAHNRDESLVTREEPRSGVVQSSRGVNPSAGRSADTSTKPFVIAKRALWEAYQQVKANRGAAGIDDESIAMFEQNVPRNLYKLWNRMSSGSYFGEASIDSEGEGRHSQAGDSYSRGSDRADRRQADHGAHAGSDVSSGFV